MKQSCDPSIKVCEEYADSTIAVCGYCHAPPDKPCVWHDGKEWKPTQPHYNRFVRAQGVEIARLRATIREMKQWRTTPSRNKKHAETAASNNK